MFLFPFWFAFAFFGTWYGLSLRRSAAGSAPINSVPLMVVIGTLAAASMFLVTERVARVIGEALAADMKLDVRRVLHGVTVYSEARLQLAGDDVVETDFDDPQAAYRYRYDGLFLLQQSGDKYFLLTQDWSRGRGRLVVLPDDATIRLEYGPGRSER
jgi:hypothetical protein